MALEEKRTFGSAGGDSNTIGLQEIVLIFAFFIVPKNRFSNNLQRTDKETSNVFKRRKKKE